MLSLLLGSLDPVDEGLKLLGGKLVHLVAELAGKLAAPLLLEDLLQLIRPQADESPLHPLPAAVAAVLTGQVSRISSSKSDKTVRSRASGSSF